MLPFVTPVELPDGGLSVPRFYVLTGRDQAIPPSLQRRMAEEGGATVLVELDSDDSPFLSHPDDLLAALARVPGADADWPPVGAYRFGDPVVRPHVGARTGTGD